MVEMTCALVERMNAIPDPRRQCQNLKHRLDDILVLSFCGVLAGCDDFVEIAEWARQHADFLRTFLALPNGIPSHDTLNRVFALVNPAAVQDALLAWLLERRGPPGPAIHLDGKTLRRTGGGRQGLGPLHVVSAWAGQAGLTLGQVAVDAKSNEITALPQLLEVLDLRRKVATIDAMGCQRDIAERIVEQGGDYVLAVKDNQPTLHAEVRAAFAAAPSPMLPHREVTTTGDDHGRVERRTVSVLPAAVYLSPSTRAAWLGLRTLIQVLRVVTCKATGGVTQEVAYYISSLRPNPTRLGDLIRGHWRIENGLHWVLDVVFREDARRLYDRTATANVAFLNRLAVSVLRGDSSPGSLKVKRKRAGWSIQYLAKLLDIPST